MLVSYIFDQIFFSPRMQGPGKNPPKFGLAPGRSEGQRYTGRVKKYISDKGFGFIALSDGLHVHFPRVL
jgi:hypothetical protein